MMTGGLDNLHPHAPNLEFLDPKLQGSGTRQRIYLGSLSQETSLLVEGEKLYHKSGSRHSR